MSTTQRIEEEAYNTISMQERATDEFSSEENRQMHVRIVKNCVKRLCRLLAASENASNEVMDYYVQQALYIGASYNMNEVEPFNLIVQEMARKEREARLVRDELLDIIEEAPEVVAGSEKEDRFWEIINQIDISFFPYSEQKEIDEFREELCDLGQQAELAQEAALQYEMEALAEQQDYSEEIIVWDSTQQDYSEEIIVIPFTK